MKRILARAVPLVVLALLLTGCASLGIRPSEPKYAIEIEGVDNSGNAIIITNTACAEFVAYANYVQELGKLTFRGQHRTVSGFMPRGRLLSRL